MASIAKSAAAKAPHHGPKADRGQSNSAEAWDSLNGESRTKSSHQDDNEKKMRKAKEKGILQRRSNDARQNEIIKSLEVDPKTEVGRKEERPAKQDKQRHDRKQEWRKIRRQQGLLPQHSSPKLPLDSLPLEENSKEPHEVASQGIAGESVKSKAVQGLSIIAHPPLTNTYSHSEQSDTNSSSSQSTTQETSASKKYVSRNEVTRQHPYTALPAPKTLGLHQLSNSPAKRSSLTFGDNHVRRDKDDDTVFKPLTDSAGRTTSNVLSEHLRFSISPRKDTPFIQRLKNAHLKSKQLSNSNLSSSSIRKQGIEPDDSGKPLRRSADPGLKQLPLRGMKDSTGSENSFPVFSKPKDLVAHKSIQTEIERAPKILASQDSISSPNQRRSQSNPLSSLPSVGERGKGHDNNEPLTSQQEQVEGGGADVQDNISHQPLAIPKSLSDSMAAVSIRSPSRTPTLPETSLPRAPSTASIFTDILSPPQHKKKNFFKRSLNNKIGLQDDIVRASRRSFDITKSVEVINLVDSEDEEGSAPASLFFGLQPTVQYGIDKPTPDSFPISHLGTQTHSVLFSRGQPNCSVQPYRTHSTNRAAKVKALQHRAKPPTSPVCPVSEHARSAPAIPFHPKPSLISQDLVGSPEPATALEESLVTAFPSTNDFELETVVDQIGNRDPAIGASCIANTTAISLTTTIIENPPNPADCVYMEDKSSVATHKQTVASLSKAPHNHADIGLVSGFSQIDHSPRSQLENHQSFMGNNEVTNTALSNSKSSAKFEPSDHVDDTQMPEKLKCKCGLDVVEWNVVYCANRTSRKYSCPHPAYHLLCSDAGLVLEGRIRQGEWFCMDCRKKRRNFSVSSAPNGINNLEDDDDKEHGQSDAQVASNYINSTIIPHTTRSIRESSPNAQPRKKQRMSKNTSATNALDVILTPDANFDSSSNQPTYNLPDLLDADHIEKAEMPALNKIQYSEIMNHANNGRGPKQNLGREGVDINSSPADALSTTLASSNATRNTLYAQSQNTAASGMKLHWLQPGQLKMPRQGHGPCRTCNGTQSSRWHRKLLKETPPGDGKFWCLKCYQKDSNEKRAAKKIMMEKAHGRTGNGAKPSRPKTMLSKKRDLIEAQMNAAFKKFHELREEDAPQKEIDAQDLAVKELMKAHKQLQANAKDATAELR